MKELPKDIIEELNIRFKGDVDQATKMLYDYLTTADDLNPDRVVRCILYLTKNGVTQLKEYIEVAKKDPRDVMFWAEYEDITTAEPQRVRDFNQTFKENE